MVTRNIHHAGEDSRGTDNQQAKNHSTSQSKSEPSPPLSIQRVRGELFSDFTNTKESGIN
jgi:hypothetical protein